MQVVVTASQCPGPHVRGALSTTETVRFLPACTNESSQIDHRKMFALDFGKVIRGAGTDRSFLNNGKLHSSFS